MIGQNELIETVDAMIDKGKFPRFSLILGASGSGKYLICRHIAKRMQVNFINVEVGIDAIRDMIHTAYSVSEPTMYVVRRADKLSTAAQNALLKVTEEPPNMAFIVLTASNDNLLLSTILSRSTVFRMNVYTPNEIFEYMKSKYNYNMDDIATITDICETPGEVDMMFKYNVSDFLGYVNLVVENIAVVSGANSFKISDKLNLGNDEDKYNLRLFWKAFIVVCVQNISTCPAKFSYGVKTTSSYLQKLRVNGLNLSLAFDMWLLDIRKEWMLYAEDN